METRVHCYRSHKAIWCLSRSFPSRWLLHFLGKGEDQTTEMTRAFPGAPRSLPHCTYVQYAGQPCEAAYSTIILSVYSARNCSREVHGACQPHHSYEQSLEPQGSLWAGPVSGSQANQGRILIYLVWPQSLCSCDGLDLYYNRVQVFHGSRFSTEYKLLVT